MRIVLDTDVMVAAVRSSRGASRVVLDAVLDRRAVGIVTVALVIEYEAVLTRQTHLAASGLVRSDMLQLIDAVAAAADRVEIAYRWRPLLPDPGDDLVIEAAINGRADAVVTFNGRHFEPAAGRFGVRVWAPGLVLEMLER